MTLREAMENGSKIRRNDELIVASVDGELVMLSVEEGQYFGVSGVGTRIWELLESPRTADELIECILEEFEVDEKTCRKDVCEFLERMLEMDLLAPQSTRQ